MARRQDSIGSSLPDVREAGVRTRIRAPALRPTELTRVPQVLPSLVRTAPTSSFAMARRQDSIGSSLPDVREAGNQG
jgi:hypothetical protein